MLSWYAQLPLNTQFIIAYLGLINVASFFYFGLDKLKSQLATRRISEKTLLLLTLIGGSLGTLLGMWFFRHKTKKMSFQAVIALILALHVLLLYFHIS